jgi:predicted transcriptional regulator
MAKARQGRDVTDAEFAVLEALWKRGPSTIRQILAEIYPTATTSDYATVQKLLERLESKGCVARDRSSFAHVFTAAISREALIGQQLQSVAEKLCEGSTTPILMQLVKAGRLTARDRDMLRRLLDQAESEEQE